MLNLDKQFNEDLPHNVVEYIKELEDECAELSKQLVFACNGLLKPTDAHELRKWAEKATKILCGEKEDAN